MLTQERLKQLLSYDPLTGVWRWLVDRGRNPRRSRAGDVAGRISQPNKPNGGYRCIQVDGRSYRSNRLAVFYMTGAWPEQLVDHENGIHDDDRWENLRPATNSQNQQNKKLQCNNTSGFKGVYFDRRRGKWRASIYCNYGRHSLGYHTTREAAIIAIAEASERLHGEFAHKQSMLPARRLLAAKREQEFNDYCNRLSASM
jgi:hypothetical protein